MPRVFRYQIMDIIKKRWSPHAYSQEVIPRGDILALLEAASFAPSCLNEQPWRFLIADEPALLEKMRQVLTPNNQLWASQAPVLILIAARKTYMSNGETNEWHEFDTGTAWGFLALEAQQRGLITHAMGGFDPEKAIELFNISDLYEIITVVAVGRYGDKNQLSKKLQGREHPKSRKPVEELLL